MKSFKMRISFAALLCGLCATAVSGQFVQDPSLFPANRTVIDFSSYTSFQRVPGPVDINYPGASTDKVTLTSTAVITFSSTNYSLRSNGHWGVGRMGYFGLDNVNQVPSGTAAEGTFTFVDGPVSAVGAFMNYSLEFGETTPMGGDTLISALDTAGNVLDSFNIPALAPISTFLQVDGGAFRGIVRAQNDIAAVRFSNSYLVVDDLTFARAVPEPTQSAILLSSAISLAALALWRRIALASILGHAPPGWLNSRE